MPLVQKCARPEFANQFANPVLSPARRVVQVVPKAPVIPKKLYIVSGRFLIPGTRVVAVIPQLRIFAVDVDDVTQQIQPAIEAHVAKEHAKDLPRDRGVKSRFVSLSLTFLKLNLQIVEYAAAAAIAARKTVVEVPSVSVQTAAMLDIEAAKLSADWLLMVEADAAAADAAEAT